MDVYEQRRSIFHITDADHFFQLFVMVVKNSRERPGGVQIVEHKRQSSGEAEERGEMVTQKPKQGFVV